MIPKRIISLLRQKALSSSTRGDSTIVIFNPATVGLTSPSTEFGVARLIGHEGWAYPAADLPTAERLAESMLQDSMENTTSRAYKYNEGSGFMSS